MDIVERLRLRPEREMLYIDGCVAAGYGPTIEAQAADEIERLRRERDIALADLASLHTAWEDWKVYHSTSRLEAEHAAERYKLRQECDEWLDRCTDAQASADIARKERDAVVRIAQYDSEEVQKLKGQIEKLNDDLTTAKDDLVAARPLLLLAKDACRLAREGKPIPWSFLEEKFDAALALKDEP